MSFALGWTMTDLAQQYLSEGRLDDALAALQAQIRKNPADADLRVFLFQLLAVKADWERALKQLLVCGELDSHALPMVQVYREAIRCEGLRSSVFSGETTPLFLGEPDYWMALLVEALKHSASGQWESALSLAAQAFDLAPALTGVINGETFDWLCDSDSRLGPIFEFIINGQYYWVSADRLAAVHIEPPTHLRDAVWLPVRLTLSNGGELVALMPSRYPMAEAYTDDLFRLAKKTEWQEPVDNYVIASGQKTFATDLADYPLFQIREINFNSVEAGADGKEV